MFLQVTCASFVSHLWSHSTPVAPFIYELQTVSRELGTLQKSGFCLQNTEAVPVTWLEIMCYVYYHNFIWHGTTLESIVSISHTFWSCFFMTWNQCGNSDCWIPIIKHFSECLICAMKMKWQYSYFILCINLFIGALDLVSKAVRLNRE